jgi:glucans biosynthesis protein
VKRRFIAGPYGGLDTNRDFDHYQDDGAFYNRRPSLWVEPKAGWSAGSIDLVELPAQDETSDNIVAFWTPERKPQPGEELLLSYRLYWGAQPPVLPMVARCLATRTGIGGVIGRPRKYYSHRFAVDFAGGALSRLGNDARVEAVVTASRGKLEIVSARPLDAINGWRAMFDLRPEDRST